MNNKTTTGLDLSAVKWATVPLHIPDNQGGAYKTELVLQRVPHVEKINWWHGPDPRNLPHNHPWTFRSTILSGGYTETRWERPDPESNLWVKVEKTYKAGDVNDMPAHTFHTVDAVEPATVTHMVCGDLVNDGKWGHMLVDVDPMEGLFTFLEAKGDPTFLEKLRAINPHMRKK